MQIDYQFLHYHYKKPFTVHPFTTTNRLEISNPQRQPGLFYLHPRIGVATTSSPNVTVSIAQTSSLSNTFTTTAGVTAAAVTAAVGFSVTQSRSMTVQGSWTSPAGSRGGMFEAFGLFNRYTFDVWSITRNSAGAIVGNDWVDRGNAYRSTGGIHFVSTVWW